MSESTSGEIRTPGAPFGQDRLLQALIEPEDVRVLVADVSATAFESEFRHLSGRLSAEVTASLCAASVLLSADLKNDERLSFQAKVSGPLGGFLYEVDQDLNFRGSTHRKVLADLDPTNADVESALGSGNLQVLRSTSRGIIYQGITALGSGSLVADLEQHLTESQQVASRLLLNHGYQRQLTHAMGVLIQALPSTDAETFETITAAITARANALAPWPRDPHQLLKELTHGWRVRTLTERSVAFRCRCSRERVINMLRSMGPPEDGSGWPPLSRVACAFCADLFEIPPDEISSNLTPPA